MQKDLKIIFFGTPEFSVPALQSLIDSGFNVSAIVTRPDKPVGRKQILTPPPVKVLAEENKIKVLQPIKIGQEVIDEVKSLGPNLFVIVAYGKILPQELLDIPEQGSVNIHPSLLPKYRGPSPLQATILSGDEKAGVCIMLIDEEMDHGPVLARYEIDNAMQYDYETLGGELFELGAKYLPEVITKYISGKIKPQAQDHERATFTKIIKKEDGLIDWNQPAGHIERMARAYHHWPSAFGRIKNYESSIKFLKVCVSQEKIHKEPGTPFMTAEKKLAIACGENSALIIEELHPAGKKKMTAAEFMRGHILT